MKSQARSVLERLSRLPATRLRPAAAGHAAETLIGLITDLVRRPWQEVGALHYLDDYSRTQWLTRDSLRELQSAKLRRLVWHCYLNVPGYASMLSESLRPAEIERLASPVNLPRLTHRARTAGEFRAREGGAGEELAARQTAIRMRVARWRAARTFERPEFGVIAASCGAGMHLMADHLLVEEVDGQLLITDLHNYDAPYLRYHSEIKGKIRTEPCGCGRGLPLVEL